jgi:HSP20 family protein
MEDMIMNIVRYDPFRELRGLQDEMNRLFSGMNPSAPNREEMVHGAWMPNVDIYDDKDQLILEAELPGMKQDDFDISIENNVITLKGERRFEKKAEGDNYHRIERAYGTFSRSFTLPQEVSAEGATADFEDGILRVTLPKREETKARKIQVRGASRGNEPKTIETESRPSGKSSEKSGTAKA